jgi:hypothetical protein
VAVLRLQYADTAGTMEAARLSRVAGDAAACQPRRRTERSLAAMVGVLVSVIAVSSWSCWR